MCGMIFLYFNQFPPLTPPKRPKVRKDQIKKVLEFCRLDEEYANRNTLLFSNRRLLHFVSSQQI